MRLLRSVSIASRSVCSGVSVTTSRVITSSTTMDTQLFGRWHFFCRSSGKVSSKGCTMKQVFAAALAALALTAAACTSGSSENTLPIFPAPTPPSTTETFTGTVQVGGGDIHTFSAAAGNISVTLTDAAPPAAIVMGLGLGTPATDGSCVFFSGAAVRAQAGTTAQLSGTLQSGGSLCVDVFDIGNQSEPVSYSVTVVHL